MAGKDKKTDDMMEETLIELFDEEVSDKKSKDKKSKDKNNKDAKNMDKKRRRRKKGGAGKKVLISLGVTTALLAASYFGVAMYFNSHFMFDTKINGVDFSLKSVEEVESYFNMT